MTRKCLIVLTLIALFSGPALAHPTWGVTTAMMWDWAKKEYNVDVYIKVVRWADLYVEWAIVLVQQDADGARWAKGDFVGCTWIEVCNNFEQLKVDAEVINTEEGLAQSWYVSLTESATHGDVNAPANAPANLKPFELNKTSEVVDDGVDGDGGSLVLNLTGSHGWLYLCVKATGVDPQKMAFDPAGYDATTGVNQNVKKVAEVLLTYYPNLAPTGADADFGSVGSTSGSATDLGAGAWDPDGHIPNGHPTPNQQP